MTRERTSPPPRVTERHKARVRLLILTFLALLAPALAGAPSALAWVVYVLFIVGYSLWSLRLVRSFSGDRRLGYFLCLTDTAALLPLIAWSSAAVTRAALILIWATGLAVTFWADRSKTTAAMLASRAVRTGGRRSEPSAGEEPAGATGLERAVRVRLGVFTANGARFGLVVLRVLRFEETASYYGEDASERVLSAVGRRGMRLLVHDAQRFVLPGGRVAFLFETEPEIEIAGDQGRREARFGWNAPYDVEGLAMSLGRKVCEHLVDGHRVECAVGWAAAPADGLNADDLMDVAESGAQSTAAFRRVAGSQVSGADRARAEAG
ncbi:MAG: hypothetical protein ABH877_02785 [bacterium]